MSPRLRVYMVAMLGVVVGTLNMALPGWWALVSALGGGFALGWFSAIVADRLTHPRVTVGRDFLGSPLSREEADRLSASLADAMERNRARDAALFDRIAREGR